MTVSVDKNGTITAVKGRIKPDDPIMTSRPKRIWLVF